MCALSKAFEAKHEVLFWSGKKPFPTYSQRDSKNDGSEGWSTWNRATSQNYPIAQRERDRAGWHATLWKERGRPLDPVPYLHLNNILSILYCS